MFYFDKNNRTNTIHCSILKNKKNHNHSFHETSIQEIMHVVLSLYNEFYHIGIDLFHLNY